MTLTCSSLSLRFLAALHSFSCNPQWSFTLTQLTTGKLRRFFEDSLWLYFEVFCYSSDLLHHHYCQSWRFIGRHQNLFWTGWNFWGSLTWVTQFITMRLSIVFCIYRIFHFTFCFSFILTRYDFGTWFIFIFFGVVSRVLRLVSKVWVFITDVIAKVFYWIFKVFRIVFLGLFFSLTTFRLSFWVSGCFVAVGFPCFWLLRWVRSIYLLWCWCGWFIERVCRR